VIIRGVEPLFEPFLFSHHGAKVQPVLIILQKGYSPFILSTKGIDKQSLKVIKGIKIVSSLQEISKG
jgi:hypothetical protein